MSKVRLGIVGCGNIAGVHLNNLKQDERIELTALCDIVEEKAAAKAAENGDPAVYADHQKMLADGVCDAVIVCTPHYGHTTIGIDALKAGHHVLVEKPLSVHKADCERLIAAHTDKNLVFSAMFNQRTDPSSIKLKQMIEGGELGRIFRRQLTITDWFRSQTYYSSGGWRATWEGEGGGVLLNQCPHNLDLWQWWFGMPSEVRSYCQLGRYHDIEVEDDVTAYMKYEDGSSGVFIASTGEAPGTNRLEIAADHGKLTLEGGKITFVRTEVPVSTFCAESEKAFAQPPRETIEVELEPEAEGTNQHGRILSNFANAILNGEALIAPAEEGIHSVELANAMLFSSATDTTTQIPINGADYEKLLMDRIANSTHVKESREVGNADMSASFG